MQHGTGGSWRLLPTRWYVSCRLEADCMHKGAHLGRSLGCLQGCPGCPGSRMLSGAAEWETCFSFVRRSCETGDGWRSEKRSRGRVAVCAVVCIVDQFCCTRGRGMGLSGVKIAGAKPARISCSTTGFSASSMTSLHHLRSGPCAWHSRRTAYQHSASRSHGQDRTICTEGVRKQAACEK